MFVVILNRYFDCGEQQRFHSQKGFHILGDLLDFVKKEYQDFNVVSVYCTHDPEQKFHFKYSEINHAPLCCELNINGKLFAQLRVNESGKLEWFYE